MKYNECIIEKDKMCNDCGRCDYCDINPSKICDNCGLCIDTLDDYTSIQIDEIEI